MCSLLESGELVGTLEAKKYKLLEKISYLNPYFQFSGPGVWEAALNTATSPLPPTTQPPASAPPTRFLCLLPVKLSSLFVVERLFHFFTQSPRSGWEHPPAFVFFVNCPAFNFLTPDLFLVHPWALICSSSYFYSPSYSPALDNFLNYSSQEIVVALFIFEILTHDKFIILKFQNIRLDLAW